MLILMHLSRAVGAYQFFQVIYCFLDFSTVVGIAYKDSFFTYFRSDPVSLHIGTALYRLDHRLEGFVSGEHKSVGIVNKGITCYPRHLVVGTRKAAVYNNYLSAAFYGGFSLCVMYRYMTVYNMWVFPLNTEFGKYFLGGFLPVYKFITIKRPV